MDPLTSEALTASEALFRGIGVSSGVVFGTVFLKSPHDDHVLERDIAREEVPREIARFESALIATRRQIRGLQKDCDPAVASIFDAHLLIMDDRPFIENIIVDGKTY